jgi:hypothetical protein
MFKLNGLHLLLTYQCTFECDHCFVWGSPWQSGTMTLKDIRRIVNEAESIGSIRWIFFEGGEPTLYYPILLKAVQEAHERGFQVGIVSNAYWATDFEDALEYLKPFIGLVEDFTLSSDLYHYSEKLSRQVQNAAGAADRLGIPVGVISVSQPEATDSACAVGKLPEVESGVMYRGRAAQELSTRTTHHGWETLTECPHEDLREVGRVHVDPLGNLHVCQGISMGNLFQEPLVKICDRYEPVAHPIIGALLSGGPAELVRRFNPPHEEAYADACHLCYEARRNLRERFPEILTPDQMYGAFQS